MHPLPLAALVLVAVVTVGASVLQHRRVSRLTLELADLRAQLSEVPGATPASTRPIPMPAAPARSVARSSLDAGDPSLSRRLDAIEDLLASLSAANEHLMDRGQLPLSAEKTAQLLAKLSDPTLADRDRLQALRLLRRNDSLDDGALQVSLQWLNDASDTGTRTRLVQQLAGLTNAVLKAPLLALAAGDPSTEVRQQAVTGLRKFIEDPQVEAQLWSVLTSESEAGIRREARNALMEGPLNESRVASLRQRASETTGSLEERTLAWQALRKSGIDAPEVTSALAQLAMAPMETRDRLRLFETFNQASDPAFVAPLVNGLQDPNPTVRARAADALSDFRTEPVVEEWYRYLAENDADPGVRRQAVRVLNQESANDRARNMMQRMRPGQAPRDRGRP